jgi:acyl-CoA thioesterase-1
MAARAILRLKEELSATYAPASGSPNYAARDVDKVLFLGTSITGGDGTAIPATQGYAPRTEAVVETLLPGMTITPINAGVSGNTSTQMLARLPALLATHKPRLVFIETSINDSRIDLSITPETTRDNTRKMVSMVRLAGATPLVGTSAPIDVGQYNNHSVYSYGSVIKARAANDYTRALCTELGVQLVDLYNAFSGVPYSLADGIHPSYDGHGDWATIVGRAIAGQLLVVGNVPPTLTTLASDTFDRANSATTMGTDSTGKTWTTSGVWGISSNKAYWVSGADTTLLDVAANDVEASVTVGVVNAWESRIASVVIRAVDGSNYFLADMSLAQNATSGVMHIYRCVAGSFTAILTATISGLPANTDYKLTFSGRGSLFKVAINDVPVGRITNTQAIAGTKVGIRYPGAGALRFDNFLATT